MTTFTTKGKIQLLRDGVLVSQHTVAEEAYERALNGTPGKYVVRFPDREIVTGARAPSGRSLDFSQPTNSQNLAVV